MSLKKQKNIQNNQSDSEEESDSELYQQGNQQLNLQDDFDEDEFEDDEDISDEQVLDQKMGQKKSKSFQEQVDESQSEEYLNYQDENEEEEYDDEEQEEDSEERQKRLEEEEENIQESLKLLPFEVLLKLKKENKEDRKKIIDSYYNKQKGRQNTGNSQDSQNFRKGEKPKERVFKKKNREAPMERDARIKVSDKQVIFKPSREKTRDPRFDQMSGNLNIQQYSKAYSFLDDLKNNEKAILQKEMKKKKYNNEQKQKIKEQIGQIKSDMNRQKQQIVKQQVKSKSTKKVIDAIKQGHKPHFSKKSDLKKEELKIKFQELDKQGKLDKFMETKRKKRTSKLMDAYDMLTKKRH
ncbi:hypothetical protein PPERSA_12987 [Pseudocohnilembus persalinus]|uniref:rRNA biogenesis protein RRP36 n=1 Tax=Pseudocohnilembus persalinus TaxID=266149 RepID=A0A0V0R2E6_PSEPJ|nr:hypothetical protein PPERSA_12987 [Pseudocohnilembus persalinus]|eukprot:KRX08506.1 hypothetical protein PPERSA_12987 [Pseudocohnilembus persalinus]